jgi:hypothetical protein
MHHQKPRKDFQNFPATQSNHFAATIDLQGSPLGRPASARFSVGAIALSAATVC